MNREGLVHRIQEAGFSAFARDWRFGESVGCRRKDSARSLGDLYLFPTTLGWGILAPTLRSEPDFEQDDSTGEACQLAIGILASPHLPFLAEEVIITQARCEGGDGSWAEFRPTGIRRTLFLTKDGVRQEYRTRSQALWEMAVELAWNPVEQD